MFNDKENIQNYKICLYCKFYRELNPEINDIEFIESLQGKGICFIDEHSIYPEDTCEWWHE